MTKTEKKLTQDEAAFVVGQVLNVAYGFVGTPETFYVTTRKAGRKAVKGPLTKEIRYRDGRNFDELVGEGKTWEDAIEEAKDLVAYSICPGCGRYMPGGEIIEKCPHCKAKLSFGTGGGQDGFALDKIVVLAGTVALDIDSPKKIAPKYRFNTTVELQPIGVHFVGCGPHATGRTIVVVNGKKLSLKNN